MISRPSTCRGPSPNTAYGINPGGEVVGTFVDTDLVQHGFLLRNGRFTAIDFPGAQGTDARGIGPSGEIVGGYWLPGEPAVNIHGYRLTRSGAFEPADYPDAINTIPQRLLPDGTILGCRHDEDTMGSMRGVVMSRQGNEEIDLFASMHNGGTPDRRRIAGLYTNVEAGRTEGEALATHAAATRAGAPPRDSSARRPCWRRFGPSPAMKSQQVAGTWKWKSGVLRLRVGVRTSTA